MNDMISIQGLTHEYITYQKAAGLVGSLKDFFGRRHKSHTALDDIHLSVEPGEMIGLLGPNGAGKTTLMKVIAGLIHPTHGTVSVMGYYPYLKPKPYLCRLGLVLGQKSQLMSDLPPSETLLFLREVYGVKEQDYQKRLAFLVDSLDVGHRLSTPVRKLSLGERMKFELIASLLHAPRLLLLDEPTIGLDISSQRAIHAFLRSMNKQHGTTILLTSHYAKDIEALSDRLIILRRGRIQYDGALGSLLSSRQDQKVLRVETTADLQCHPLNFRPLGENRWEALIPPDQLNEALRAAASVVPIQNVTTQDKPLEDLLYALFTSESGDGENLEADDD